MAGRGKHIFHVKKVVLFFVESRPTPTPQLSSSLQIPVTSVASPVTLDEALVLAAWNLECDLLATGCEQFWCHFAARPTDPTGNVGAVPAMRALASALEGLLDCVRRHRLLGRELDDELVRPRLLDCVHRLVLTQDSADCVGAAAADNFAECVGRYLDVAFADAASFKNDDPAMETDQDEAGEDAGAPGSDAESLDLAARCGRLIDLLDMRRRLASDHADAFVRRGLAAYVASHKCRGNYGEAHLDRVLRLHRRLADRLVVAGEGDAAPPGSDAVGGPQKSPSKAARDGKTTDLPYRVYGRARIRELFSMAIDYPDSECGLKDLATCIERAPALRQRMVRALRTDVEQRLLHPGVATPDILSAYIGAVRSLRILDPSGVSQELSLGPVTEYLRRREDTIRAIISKMIGDDAGAGGDLAAELTRASPLAGLGEDSGESVDDPNQDFDSWRPDPVEAYSSCGSLSRQPSDLLSLLVGIYGSKRLFINEYQNMLASRLLDSLSFKVDREIKNVELLKLRFGELDLIKSEVMLKDVEDSRRLCSLISPATQPPLLAGTQIAVSALILSAQFWPGFAPKRMSSLPGQLAPAAEQFAGRYRAQKCNRGLDWKPQLGRVTLRLELAGRSLEVICKPVHYALLVAFLNCRERSLGELAEAAEVQLSYARRSVGFWLHQGVLAEPQPDRFRLVTEAGGGGGASASYVDEAADAASAAGAGGAAAVADDEGSGSGTWDCLWNYVVGMLTNMDACMSVDRIRTMLQLFLVDPSIELDVRQLKAFLDEKVRDGQLAMKGNMYKLA